MTRQADPIPPDVALVQFTRAVVGLALNVKAHITDRLLQLSKVHFPDGNFLAYAYTPATADSMTLLLVGFTLLPFFGVPFLPCCLLLVLFGHVSFTWLVHTQNIAKFKTLEGCGTSLLAQKKMFEKRETMITRAVESLAQMQAKISALEEQHKQLQVLEQRHAELVTVTARMEEMETQVETQRRRLLRLPRLKAELARLNARRKLAEKLRWGIQVLKAETSQIESLETEYTQLLDKRAQLQARKASLQALSQQASQLQVDVQVLERTNAGSAQQSGSKAASLGRQPSLSQQPAVSTTRPNIPTGKLDTRRSLDALPAASNSDQSQTKPAPAPTKALTSTTFHTAIGTVGAQSTWELSPLPAASAAAVEAEEGTGESGAAPPARRAASDASDGSGASLLNGGVPRSRRCVVLGTPAGGSNVFEVRDNEAFHTPAVPDFTPISGTPSVAFTPGPEAAALAAAISAGTVPLPARSGLSNISLPKPLGSLISSDASRANSVSLVYKDNDNNPNKSASNRNGSDDTARVLDTDQHSSAESRPSVLSDSVTQSGLGAVKRGALSAEKGSVLLGDVRVGVDTSGAGEDVGCAPMECESTGSFSLL